jgi:mono/diheme cytochrome c family protein
MIMKSHYWLSGKPVSFLARILILLLLSVVTLVAIPRSEPAITTGSDAQARSYYKDVISKEISFDATPGVTKLDSLLDFLGYPTSALKLQALDPEVLMNPAEASSANGLGIPARGLNGATLRDGDILAARFFAPKIVNIDAKEPLPGWRKLVRLRVRPASRAARVGIESAVILFNFFTPIGQPPFVGKSANTQVMLLAPILSGRLYWLDFDGDGILGLALNASFDAADLPGGGTRDYFVPDGCNDCHGSPGNFRPPMMNYLDTDHWFDRLENDFAALKTTDSAVVFDAKTNDPSKPGFAAAFDVIRRFNEESLFQNAAVHADSFEAQAATVWLKLHADSDAHFAPVARSFPASAGPAWQASEADGLDRLNRYCFRCHGSVRFSIFDRQAVVDRAGVMRQRINPSPQQAQVPGFKMPPDRTLDDAEVQSLDDFLKKLK